MMDGDCGRTPPCPPVERGKSEAENRQSALVLLFVTLLRWLHHRLHRSVDMRRTEAFGRDLWTRHDFKNGK